MANYSALLKVLTPVLDIAREHQTGRVNKELTNVSFDFTEGWLRESGLYDLDAEWQADGEDEPKHAQLRFMVLK